MAFRSTYVHSAGRVLFGLRVHNFQKALKTRYAVLVLFHEVYKRHDGRDKQAYGYRKRRIVAHANKVFRHEKSARDEHDDIENIGDEGSGGVELPHRLICVRTGADETTVAFFEFLRLLFGIVKRLCDAYSRNAAFKGGVDFGHRLTAAHKSRAHTLAQNHGYYDQEGHAGKDDERHPPVYGAKIYKRRHNGYGGDYQIFGAVVGKLAYVHQIVCHARHNFARLVVVEKGVGQFFEMIKHIAAHLRLHFYAHDVSVVLYKVVKKHSRYIYAQKQSAANHHHAYVVLRNIIVEHGARDYGINYGDERHQKSRQHIEEEQNLMRLVICEKSF